MGEVFTVPRPSAFFFSDRDPRPPNFFPAPAALGLFFFPRFPPCAHEIFLVCWPALRLPRPMAPVEVGLRNAVFLRASLTYNLVGLWILFQAFCVLSTRRKAPAIFKENKSFFSIALPV